MRAGSGDRWRSGTSRKSVKGKGRGLEKPERGLVPGSLNPLREHHAKPALDLRIARMLERDERGIALEEHLALAARAAALLSPFAEQRPAAEQILLQDDLVVARRFGARGAGLHEQSHRPPILRRSGV